MRSEATSAMRSTREPLVEARVVDTVEVMRAWSAERDAAGLRIGFVPTMGSLHEGHLSLVDRARALSDVVVLSVFVNPAQFGPGEDFERYPRDLERDHRLASERGVDLVFAPPATEMYPAEQTIWVEPGPLADRLCGASRPGHFRGVLTVVLKLFEIVRPRIAVFGRKDFQQAVLVRRMVRELALPVEVDVAPTVREADGLALSSRNAYLSREERRAALSLPSAIARARNAFAAGERSAQRLIAGARAAIEATGARVDYVEIVTPTDLAPVTQATADAVCAVSAWVGSTRLIDNGALGGDVN